MPRGPEIPEWVDPRDLDPAVRSALRGLDPRNVDQVAAHLVAAGTLVDEDPQAALAHARAARDRASRVAVVREAVGVAAYHADDFAEAARELRAYRRMSGDQGYRAVLADCERALGRPEVALRLVAEALAESPDEEETAELRLVEAGARRDLGEVAAARLILEAALGGRPSPASLREGDAIALRFAAAYADLLHAQGEEALAREWHDAVTALDPDALADSIEFTELEEVEDAMEDAPTAADADAEVELEGVASDVDDVQTVGRSFADEVEAEVAELLGETDGGETDGGDPDGEGGVARGGLDA